MSKWDLTYLFKTEEDFEKAFEKVKKDAMELVSYKGKLGNEQDFVEYQRKSIALDKELGRVFEYVSLRSDLNKKDVANATAYAKVMNAYNSFVPLLSFETPEILSVGKEKIMGFIDRNKDLEELRFIMEKRFRNNEHVLDENSEVLMSRYIPLTDAGSNLYNNLSVADGKSKQVTLSNKTKVTVTHGNWTGLIADCDNAKDRKKVFEAIFSGYEDLKNTYAGIYESILQADKAVAENRKYASSLESHLFGNNIPLSVYKNLVDVASKQNKSLKRYIKLRKEHLGLKTYHTYDRFMELAKSDKTYSYEEGKALFFESIKAFPNDFQEKAHEVLKDGFVDVYENEGKRTGAYSSSQTDLHPFILLNYTDKLEDVFTLAHEAGHSIHSLYAQTQPASLQNYTIFVAEIASTFNEHRLLDYLIESGKATKEEKIMLLQKAIDSIISTFYRQTLFADYELQAHELCESGQVINHEVLSNIMINLYKKYYGIDINKEVYKKYVWCYIPHMYYTPFYVYQYATSFSASLKLYSEVKNNTPGAFENYINLLKSGGSEYPVTQALKAGVDFTKKDAFMAVVKRMDELVDELEKALNE